MLPSEVLPNIFLGGCPPPNTELFFSNLGITAVVNVCSECEYQVPHFISEDKYMHVCLKDEHNEELPLDRVVKFIDDSLHSLPLNSKASSSTPPRILVHCLAGMSRSASCVIAYLMFKYRLKLVHAFEVVRTQRLVVSPNMGFVGQLQKYEVALGLGSGEHLCLGKGDENKQRSSSLSSSSSSSRSLSAPACVSVQPQHTPPVSPGLPFDITSYTKLPLVPCGEYQDEYAIYDGCISSSSAE